MGPKVSCAGGQSNLGQMYGMREGVLQDNVAAHMWFNIGCANGDEAGCNNRGRAAAKMTPTEISEAQRRASVCVESDYKDCE